MTKDHLFFHRKLNVTSLGNTRKAIGPGETPKKRLKLIDDDNVELITLLFIRLRYQLTITFATIPKKRRPKKCSDHIQCNEAYS